MERVARVEDSPDGADAVRVRVPVEGPRGHVEGVARRGSAQLLGMRQGRTRGDLAEVDAEPDPFGWRVTSGAIDQLEQLVLLGRRSAEVRDAAEGPGVWVKGEAAREEEARPAREDDLDVDGSRCVSGRLAGDS